MEEGANATFLLTWNEEEEEGEHCGFVDVVPAHAGREGLVVAEVRRIIISAGLGFGCGLGALFRRGSGECGLEEDLQWGGW